MDLQPLYQGEITSLPPSPASLELTRQANLIVKQEFHPEPHTMPAEEFRQAVASARSQIAEPTFQKLALKLVRELSLPPQDLLLDQVRLRAVPPGLEKIEEAAPVFFAHRDTWYGNPSCQINAWIPLHPVDPSNSFRFYLDAFQSKAKNDSQQFSATRFRERGGFGRVKGDQLSVYPRALETASGRTWDVELDKGQLLLFSAAHLHQTLPNRSQRVRFSLDFRFYRPSHLKNGLGAPDPDNESEGLMTDGYKLCSSLEA